MFLCILSHFSFLNDVISVFSLLNKGSWISKIIKLPTYTIWDSNPEFIHWNPDSFILSFPANHVVCIQMQQTIVTKAVCYPSKNVFLLWSMLFLYKIVSSVCQGWVSTFPMLLRLPLTRNNGPLKISHQSVTSLGCRIYVLACSEELCCSSIICLLSPWSPLSLDDFSSEKKAEVAASIWMFADKCCFIVLEHKDIIRRGAAYCDTMKRIILF